MGPGTTRANIKEKTIDRIWGSQEIAISQGGYPPPFHFGPKLDHKTLWIKIPHLVAFGEKKNHLSYHQLQGDLDSTALEARINTDKNSGNSLGKEVYCIDS